MERLKLKVLEVKEREKVGKNQIDKLSFKASLGDGEGAWYFTFKTSLFEVIEAKGEIDAEVDISERVYDSNTYVDRKITQIYKDGQPIGGQKKGQWGKSPEAVQLEVEGRYRNTALMQAVELVKYDKLSIEAILSKADLFYKWLAGDKSAVKVTTMEVVKQAEKDIKDLWPEDAKPEPEPVKEQVAEPTKQEKEDLDFDPDDLLDQLKQVKWKDATVKSYCKNVYKTDSAGEPLDTNLGIVALIASLTRENQEAFFQQVSDRLSML